MSRLVRAGLVVALLVAVADWATKYLILNIVDLPARHTIALLPFLDLTMVWNRGVSFGLLQADSPLARWGLAAISAVIAAGLVVWLTRAHRLLTAVALGGIIGGALGNLYDRVAWGAVADFVDVHILGYHWYVFNLADAAISIGVGLLLIDSFRETNDDGNSDDAH